MFDFPIYEERQFLRQWPNVFERRRFSAAWALLASLLTLAAGAGPACGAEPLPFNETVSRVMDGLEYSGYEALVKPEVSLGIDFEAKTWTLHNVHSYDPDGNILLDQGRYGLCAELATHVYQRIQPLLKDAYTVRFANVSESDFFSKAQSNHIVLLIKQEATQNVYLLDPSFKKYGRLGDFPEYTVQGIQDSLSFVRDRTADISFHVDQAIPLYIKEDLLLSFAVTSVDGKFDRDNFLFVIAVNRRFETRPLDIVVFGKRNGVVEEVRRAALLEQLLSPEEFLEVYRKMNLWLQHPSA